MTNVTELKREKFAPVTLFPGDTLTIIWSEPNTGIQQALVKTDITEEMTFDEGVLFQAVFEGRRALGGIVLEQEKAA